MSFDTAIRVEGLGKRYRLGGARERYRSLRDELVQGVLAPFRRLGSVLRGESTLVSDEILWAVRDVSFQVPRGEVLGVVGRNGAGKTTLLKILSRITEPTEGRAEIHGRVGSLLEVGTGFHPELTGRENIFLNGAILGMRRDEIAAKLDDIVAFAEVERFIDTQVKHFSSGMYVRLAFAVAAHLEPEVLLIDEVLAVGDAGFQRKCIRSIQQNTRKGRTALVVSHNMGLVRSLCSRALLLEKGRVVAEGVPEEVIATYHQTFDAREAAFEANAEERDAHLARAVLRDARGDAVTEIPCGESFSVALQMHVREGFSIPRPWIGVRIYTWYGELVAHLANREAGCELPSLETTTWVRCEIRHPNLLPGRYWLGVVLADVNDRLYDRVEHAVPFSVTAADVFGSGMLPSTRHGQVFFKSRWSVSDAHPLGTKEVSGPRGRTDP